MRPVLGTTARRAAAGRREMHRRVVTFRAARRRVGMHPAATTALREGGAGADRGEARENPQRQGDMAVTTAARTDYIINTLK